MACPWFCHCGMGMDFALFTGEFSTAMVSRRSPAGSSARLLVASVPLLLAACVTDKEPPAVSGPSFYRSMAAANSEVGAAMAASMISGYRRNNGLSDVAVDGELMRLAREQATVMAARDKLDH